MLYFRRNRAGVGARGHLRSDADDDAGHVLVAGRAPGSSRALRGELYMIARTPRNTGPKIAEPDGRIALGRRHEHGLAGQPPRHVPGVIVAIAEEEDEVEIGAPRGRGSRSSAGLAGPSLSSQASSSASECALVEHARAIAGRTRAGCRSCATGKRRTGTPLTCSTPAGQLVAPRDVVARAGRDDLDLARAAPGVRRCSARAVPRRR